MDSFDHLKNPISRRYYGKYKKAESRPSSSFSVRLLAQGSSPSARLRLIVCGCHEARAGISADSTQEFMFLNGCSWRPQNNASSIVLLYYIGSFAQAPLPCMCIFPPVGVGSSWLLASSGSAEASACLALRRRARRIGSSSAALAFDDLGAPGLLNQCPRCLLT